jgi:membrane fusion protein (multidrug efflux system)
MQPKKTRVAPPDPSGEREPPGSPAGNAAPSSPTRAELAETRERPSAAAARQPEDESVRSRRRLRAVLMLGGILAVAAVAGFFWLRGGRFASTDDAYVRAAKLMVTTDVSGIVGNVEVREGQSVKAGDVLFRLDPRQFEIALDNANAALAQTALAIEAMKHDYRRVLSDIAAQQAQVDLDQANFDRYASLVATDAISKANYDQARFSLQADKNRLVSLHRQADMQLTRLTGNADIATTTHPQYLQAKAQVDEARRLLDHSVVRAPYDGVVTQVDALQPGTFLVAQTAALTNVGAIALVSADKVWVDANMKETDLTYVEVGNKVEIRVDTYPGTVWSGTVESVAPASGAEFSILPPQNASGNWVKVVQRIPVRILIDRNDGGRRLRAGMSVVVDIDTGHRRSLADLLW